MSPEHNDKEQELRRRREQRREITRQKQQRQAVLRLLLMAAALVLATVLIVWTSRNASTQPPQTEATQPSYSVSGTEDEDGEEVWETEPTTVIHIAAAGDLNVTDEIVKEAMTVSGYSFSGAFLDVAPVLSGADLTLLNFEGTLAGPPYGSETGSAPTALAQALAQYGVDVVQTANSASIRAGVLGLQSTIAALENVGITPVGTFTDTDAFERSGGFTLLDVQGIRVALVAFTKGMDNLGLPEGSAHCVNLLYRDYTTDYKEIDRDGIHSVMRGVAASEPDITIALVHWGSELNENLSDSQQTIAQLLLSDGADAVLGTHSHLLGAIEYDENAGTLIAWSLGDFFGNADEAGTNYSVILDMEITMDNQLGTASITGFSTTPIYTLRPEQSLLGGRRVVRMEQALARYNSRYIGRITDSTAQAMEYALTRVPQRVTARDPEPTEES